MVKQFLCPTPHSAEGTTPFCVLSLFCTCRLVQILVDPDLKAKAQQFLYQGVPKDPEPPKAATGGGSKCLTLPAHWPQLPGA